MSYISIETRIKELTKQGYALWKVSDHDPTPEEIPPDPNVFWVNKSTGKVFIPQFNEDGSVSWGESPVGGTSNPIITPSIISPTNGATDFTGPITSSPFQTADWYSGTHTATDWEIALDANFEQIVESSYNDTVNKTSYSFTQLQPVTTYYVRVRYRSGSFISNWSQPVQFTTSNAYIVAPTVTLVAGQDTLTPTFQTSEFQAIGYTDQWASTEWQIATDQNFTNVVYSYTEEDSTKQYTFTVPSGTLSINTTYYIRARFTGSEGHVSDWSQAVSFTTPNAAILTPTITVESPEGSLYPTFKLSPFQAIGYTDQWASTEWQIATDQDFTNTIYVYTETDSSRADIWSVTQDLFALNSTYYVRARYNGTEGHSSDWAVLEYHTSLYQIEFTVPSEAYEQTVLTIPVTHDGGRSFDTSNYILKGQVTGGTLSISGMVATWTLPDIDQDTTLSISLWVEDTSGTQVSTKKTVSVMVRSVTFVSDAAVIITDFSDYEYNDGWTV